MIEVHITETGKSYNPKDKFRFLNKEVLRFPNMQKAKKALKEHYGRAKRVPMYCDKKDGSTVQTGYVYGFRNKDISHVPVHKWIQQDWVSFRECKELHL